jgi:hypothetical protein
MTMCRYVVVPYLRHASHITLAHMVTDQQLIGPVAVHCIVIDHDRTICSYERVQLLTADLVSIRRS